MLYCCNISWPWTLDLAPTVKLYEIFSSKAYTRYEILDPLHWNSFACWCIYITLYQSDWMAGTHAYWLSPFKYLMMKWFDNTFKGTSSQHKDKKAPNSPVCGRAGQLQVAPPAGCWHPPEARGARIKLIEPESAVTTVTVGITFRSFSCPVPRSRAENNIEIC